MSRRIDFRSMWNCVQVKEEAWEGVSAAAEREGLYAGHEVKQELLVGPEVLQPQDAAFRLGPKFVVTIVKEELSDVESDGTGDCLNNTYGEYPDEGSQFTKDSRMLMLKPCIVRLDRILIDKEYSENNNIIQHKIYASNLKDTHVNSEKNSGIQSHKPDHTKEVFICNYCDSKFIYRKKIIKHLQRCSKKTKVSRDSAYSCKICNRRFRKALNLMKHEQIHSGLKSYKCETCGKLYFQSSHLSRHKKTHTSKPVCAKEINSCDICSKIYSSKYNLSIHTRTHTGQMPYICQHCGKQFNKMSILVRHEETHVDKTENEKQSHFCEICNKWFATKWNLKKHNRSHANETPYSCDICCKKYMHSYSLTKHKRSRKHALKTELLTCPKKGALKSRNK